jgi:hypothetical protein
MNENTMFTTLILSATALAIAAITVQSPGAAGPPPSTNPLTRPWTGPYGGVPPWDLAKPELFPGAFEAAIVEQRAEIDAIVADPGSPSFENRIASAASSTCFARTSAHRKSRPWIANGSRSWLPPRTRSC